MQSGASTGSADDDDNEGRVDRARFDSGSDAVVDPDVCVGADGKVAAKGSWKCPGETVEVTIE